MSLNLLAGIALAAMLVLGYLAGYGDGKAAVQTEWDFARFDAAIKRLRGDRP